MENVLKGGSDLQDCLQIHMVAKVIAESREGRRVVGVRQITGKKEKTDEGSAKNPTGTVGKGGCGI